MKDNSTKDNSVKDNSMKDKAVQDPTNQTVTIRPIEEADRLAFIDLYEAVAAEGRWIGGELPVNRSELGGRVDRALTMDNVCMLVAESDGTMVGHCGAFAVGGLVSFGMVLDTDFRGHGIGRLLMADVIVWAREIGAHKMTLEAWPHNERAIALYDRMGFVIEGRQRRHWRRNNGELWDAVLMGLVLDEDSPGSPYPDSVDT